MQWKYEIISFNTHDYGEEKMQSELDKLGHEKWEAVSMAVLPNGWTRVLFKKPDK